MKTRELQWWFYLSGAVVLVLGLAGAAFVYATAADEEFDATEATFSSASKPYRHELERFGGKSSIMADDFMQWFAGLWHGKRLARTLLVLSIVIAAVCFWIGHNLPDIRG
jgi:hypothetical protein